MNNIHQGHSSLLFPDLRIDNRNSSLFFKLIKTSYSFSSNSTVTIILPFSSTSKIHRAFLSFDRPRKFPIADGMVVLNIPLFSCIFVLYIIFFIPFCLFYTCINIYKITLYKVYLYSLRKFVRFIYCLIQLALRKTLRFSLKI